MYIPFKNIIASVVLGVVLLLLSAFATADGHGHENEGGVSAEVSLFYHNKYIDEGMRELADGGIFTPEIILNFEDFHVGEAKLPDFYIGGWWAIGDSEDFTETNLFIGKVFEWNNFSLDLSYTWLNTDEEGEEGSSEDCEIVAALGCEECIPFVEPEIAYVYSSEASGGAVEIELSKEIELNSISIEPHVGMLIDFGYVDEEYDGLNHIVVGVDVSIPINDQVSLGIYGAHSFAQENIRRMGGGENHTWGGIGLEFEI